MIETHRVQQQHILLGQILDKFSKIIYLFILSNPGPLQVTNGTQVLFLALYFFFKVTSQLHQLEGRNILS